MVTITIGNLKYPQDHCQLIILLIRDHWNKRGMIEIDIEIDIETREDRNYNKKGLIIEDMNKGRIIEDLAIDMFLESRCCLLSLRSNPNKYRRHNDDDDDSDMEPGFVDTMREDKTEVRTCLFL